MSKIENLRLEIWEVSNIAIVFLMGMVRERVKKSQKIEMKYKNPSKPSKPLPLAPLFLKGTMGGNRDTREHFEQSLHQHRKITTALGSLRF